MTRDIRIEPIVKRIAANPELGMIGLNREAVQLLIKTCELLDIPRDWIEMKRALDPDIVASIALLLGDVLDAVQAELENPTPYLSAVPEANSAGGVA